MSEIVKTTKQYATGTINRKKTLASLLITEVQNEQSLVGKTKIVKLTNAQEKLRKKKDNVNSISIIAREALARGGGKACLASHGNGCRHYGILDLRRMDTKTYAFYSKDGGWLQNKFCISCKKNTKEMVMDKITKSYLIYCEMGLKSRLYSGYTCDEEKNIFDDHNCDMILCVPCWNTKVDIYEQECLQKMGNRSKRCSARKNIN